MTSYHVASIVILPLHVTGTAKAQTAQVLDDLVASAVHERSRGVRLMDARESASVLTHRGDGDSDGSDGDALHCQAVACWVDAAKTVQMDSVIGGTLGALQGRHILTLTWLAAPGGDVIDRHTELLGDNMATFPDSVVHAVRALMRRASGAPEIPMVPAVAAVSPGTQELCQDADPVACVRGKACDGGDPAACATVARWFEEGMHAERDVARAVRLYQTACEGGVSASCAELARLAMAGQGMARNQLRAMALYERSCAGGMPAACAEAADVYNYGLGEIRHDAVRAQRLYDQAAHLYQRQCDHGDALSCTALAAFYDYGQALAQNATRAAELYQRGCELGGASACSNLGELYERGNGVDKDWNRAMQLFKQGCTLGDTNGCASLSEMVERDVTR